MDKYFTSKINELINDSKDGSKSPEELLKKYEDIKSTLDFNTNAGVIDEASAKRYNEKLEQYKKIYDSKFSKTENVVDVEKEAKENESKNWKKGVAAAGAIALGAGAIAGLAHSCAKQENKEDEANKELTSLDAVNNTLSTFVNECLNNGIDLTTDEALMLMYASNIETAIDVGDNMTLDQVVVNHYIGLAEDLIANNPKYAGRLVSDVAAELMTTDYQSSLAKINDAFIKYGYIAPTSKLIANENDSKFLVSFENSLQNGIKNNGDFTEANNLVKDAFKENSKVLRGTKIIAAGQYSAINAYGQNASVKITGMDQAAFDAIFANCGGGNVNDVKYDAYTTYMTEVRSYLHLHTDQQIIAWEAKLASDNSLETLAQDKYNKINDYITKNRVELVTPENVNKARLEAIESENKQAADSLNNILNNGGKLHTDSNGNQFIVEGDISDEEKKAIEEADKAKNEQEAEIEYEDGYKEDGNGNIVDNDGNKVNPPVDDAPIMTDDEIKDIENKADDLLDNPIIEEDFEPIEGGGIVVEENEIVEVVEKGPNGEVIEKSSSSTKNQIDELQQMKEDINKIFTETPDFSQDESLVSETTPMDPSSPDFNPFEPEVSYDLEEGWNPDGTLKEGYTFDDNGNVVKVGKVK